MIVLITFLEPLLSFAIPKSPKTTLDPTDGELSRILSSCNFPIVNITSYLIIDVMHTFKSRCAIPFEWR